MPDTERDGRAGIDAGLVARLIARQFPQWAGLPVRPVAADGWDNRTYRLGEALSVRLPTAERYVAAVAKESRWLPWLASRLPLPIPEVVATGRPGDGYPFPWSVRRWLEGTPAGFARLGDPEGFGSALAGFLDALHGLDATGGPAAGAHSFFRGAGLSHYDGETRDCLRSLAGIVDTARAAAVWEAALAAAWTGPPVWFHGDIAPGNLLVRDGRLAAVIDFGTSGVGDPACDLVIAWTFLRGRSRAAFAEAVAADAGAFARARGWAPWKALLVLRDAVAAGDAAARRAELRVIAGILSNWRPRAT
jgi:aminoglycoside phosphotransferase (APT) family kinase protein